jgi:hypothetical protein
MSTAAQIMVDPGHITQRLKGLDDADTTTASTLDPKTMPLGDENAPFSTEESRFGGVESSAAERKSRLESTAIYAGSCAQTFDRVYVPDRAYWCAFRVLPGISNTCAAIPPWLTAITEGSREERCCTVSQADATAGPQRL